MNDDKQKSDQKYKKALRSENSNKHDSANLKQSTILDSKKNSDDAHISVQITTKFAMQAIRKKEPYFVMEELREACQENRQVNSMLYAHEVLTKYRLLDHQNKPIDAACKRFLEDKLPRNKPKL